MPLKVDRRVLGILFAQPDATESLFLPSDGTCLLRCRIVTSCRTTVSYLIDLPRTRTTKLHIRLEQKIPSVTPTHSFNGCIREGYR